MPSPHCICETAIHIAHVCKQVGRPHPYAIIHVQKSLVGRKVVHTNQNSKVSDILTQKCNTFGSNICLFIFSCPSNSEKLDRA